MKLVRSVSLLKCGLLLVAAAYSAAGHTLSSKAQVTPVQKVLEMMTKLQAEAAKLKDEEAATFAKYAEWADDQEKELGFEIKTGKSEIEELLAFIEEADLDVSKLGKEIVGLKGEINRMETEMDEATTLRTKENDEFSKTQQDLAESVEAIGAATEVISAGAQDKEQASLLQRVAAAVPKMPPVLMAFLEEQEVGAPKAAAYESQSDGVLAMLDKLEDKFKKELEDCETEESNKAHAYELEMQHLTDTVAALKVDLSEKEAEKGKTAAASAKAKGELVKTKAELADDEKLLLEITTTFASKSAMFEGNQKTRKEELTAISKAIEIISSDKVSFAQLGAPQVTSLLQTRSSKRRVAVRQQISRFLQQRAELLSSQRLKVAAAEVATTPFAKVIGLIKDLIGKLKEEASAEAEHKEWCDEQLKANELTRKTKGSTAEKLEASLESLTGQIDTMTKEISTLESEQAALLKAMQKATAMRLDEKSQNKKTIDDAIAGAEALKQALIVLKKFYSAQAFVQKNHQERQVPEMESYKGQTGSATGIVGMLEVIESDFLRLKAETSAEEAEAVKIYDQFMLDGQANKDKKHDKEVKLKLDKDKAEFTKSQQTKDLKLTEEQLEKANKYYEYLKPTCLEVHVSFEERSSRRKEEIEALKEAYGILDGKSS